MNVKGSGLGLNVVLLRFPLVTEEIHEQKLSLQAKN